MDGKRGEDGPFGDRIEGPDAEREHDEEVAFHLEMRERDYRARGMDEDEARAAARARMGDLDEARRGVRRQARRARAARRGDGVLRGLATDVRVAVRRLRAAPGFTAVATVTLALALAVTSAVFALADALFLRPLPYADADRLVAVWETGRDTREITTVAPPNFLDWEREARTLDGVAAFNGWPVTLGGEGGAVRLLGSVVTTDLFDVLGVEPALGPGLGPEHGEPTDSARALVAVLSHGLWMRRFGGDPGVIGSTIDLNDGTYEVVGVMPEGFRHPTTFMGFTPAEVWVPLGMGSSATNRETRYLHVVARLAPGASLADARAEMEALGASLAAAYPEANGGRTVVVRPVDEQLFGDQRPLLLLLLGAAGLVLLVACVNMANLLLVRGLGRRREFAVMAALGSGRLPVLRQLLVEAGVLGLAGGAVGALLLVLGSGAFRAAASPYLNPLAEPAVDGRVIAFTLLAALASGLLFGALPALRLSRSDLRTALVEREGTAGAGGGRNVLVAVEAALTVVLVFGAGLLGRSLLGLLHEEPGFRVERTLLFEVRPSADDYAAGDELLGYYDRLEARLEASPAIERVGFLSELPLTSENWGTTFTVPDSDLPDEEHVSEFHVVSGGWFEAAGVPILAGRGFGPDDVSGAPLVTVVNAELARRTWGDADPVGRRIVGNAGAEITVVGVAATAADDGLAVPPEPQMYFPLRQGGPRAVWVVARTAGPADEALGAVRGLVADVDARVPVSGLTTMERHVAASMSTPRGMAAVTALFGGLALLLAGVGIYGVLAHAVAERTRELGVRAALGAERGALVGLVLRHSLVVAGAGVAAGVVLALVAGRALSAWLYGVGGADPVVLGAAVATVTGASLLAAWVPARRASRIDPLVAIRAE